MDRIASRMQRISGALQLARVVSAMTTAGSFTPKPMMAHDVARIVARVSRLGRKGMNRGGGVQKAIHADGLAKRKAGTPLSEAELRQRREAARKQSEKTLDEADSVARVAGAGIGGVGGMFVGGQGVKALAGHLQDRIDRHVDTKLNATKDAVNAASDWEYQQRRAPRSASRAMVPSDGIELIDPQKAAAMRRVENARDAFKAANRAIGSIKRFGKPAVLATAVATPVIGAVGGYLWGRSAAQSYREDTRAEFDQRWDRIEASNREALGAQRAKVRQVMGEFKRGELRSGGSGKPVTDRRQAVAIALNSR